MLSVDDSWGAHVHRDFFSKKISEFFFNFFCIFSNFPKKERILFAVSLLGIYAYLQRDEPSKSTLTQQCDDAVRALRQGAEESNTVIANTRADLSFSSFRFHMQKRISLIFIGVTCSTILMFALSTTSELQILWDTSRVSFNQRAQSKIISALSPDSPLCMFEEDQYTWLRPIYERLETL